MVTDGISPFPLGNLDRYRVILASGSPRRRELLEQLEINFEVITVDADEVYPPGMPADAVPEYLSRVKADCFAQTAMDNDMLVITADTVVIADGKVLGKPVDEDDARDMLRTLSGRTHTVVSGITVMTADKTVSDSATTEVTFATLTPEEIDWYVHHYVPLDKAGAYGIQEWIGSIGISRIEGSYYNVMGLPTHRLYKLLRDF